MAKDHEEWFRQADYDMGAAETMFSGGRNIYAVFMCHLSIEKALKGLFYRKFEKQASKTHNLLFLIEEIDLDVPPDFSEFIVSLNRQSIVTRYPEDLLKMTGMYDKNRTEDIISKSKEVLQWLNQMS